MTISLFSQAIGERATRCIRYAFPLSDCQAGIHAAFKVQDFNAQKIVQPFMDRFDKKVRYCCLKILAEVRDPPLMARIKKNSKKHL
jgi:hypothetical protein